MRTPTLILSLTTATFAMSTAWLAWELHQRDAAPAMAAPGSSAGSATEPALASTGMNGKEDSLTTSTASSGYTAGAASADPAQSTRNTPAAGSALAAKRMDASDPTLAYARLLVARLDDSAQRQTLIDEQKVSIRQQYARLKEKLGLSDAKFEQLVTTLAEQNLQAQENWARCAIDAACDPKDQSRTRVDDRTQELLALLGADSYEDFTRFRDTLQERDAVAQLRGRLNDNLFLPQSQAEQLIAALADERKRYVEETTARGSSTGGWGSNLGTIMYPEDAATVEARLAEAAQYSQRLRARAATVLSAAQLAAFTQMQDELLAQMATFMRPAQRKANTLKLAQG
jgi:hypothetical protein